MGHLHGGCPRPEYTLDVALLTVGGYFDTGVREAPERLQDEAYRSAMVVALLAEPGSGYAYVWLSDLYGYHNTKIPG